MNKCKYCGKELHDNTLFCCNQCETKYKEISNKDSHKIKYFIAGIIIGFLIMLCGVLSSNDFVIGAGIVLMGIVVFLLPFTTPETTHFFWIPKVKNYRKNTGCVNDCGWNMGNHIAIINRNYNH